MDIQPITCNLCLMGDPLIFRYGAQLHSAPHDPAFLVVCADSQFFPVDLPVAVKVASA
jgi:hypothetical protein